MQDSRREANRSPGDAATAAEHSRDCRLTAVAFISISIIIIIIIIIIWPHADRGSRLRPVHRKHRDVSGFDPSRFLFQRDEILPDKGESPNLLIWDSLLCGFLLREFGVQSISLPSLSN